MDPSKHFRSYSKKRFYVISPDDRIVAVNFCYRCRDYMGTPTGFRRGQRERERADVAFFLPYLCIGQQGPML